MADLLLDPSGVEHLTAYSAAQSTGMMRKKEPPKSYKCFICFQQLNSLQNCHRDVETHKTFSYGWVCGKDSCEAAFRRLRKEDFCHHLQRHHLEVVEKEDIPQPRMVNFCPHQNGEQTYRCWAMEPEEEDELCQRAKFTCQATSGGSQSETKAGVLIPNE